MIINNYLGKRVYYQKKHLIEKIKEKPFLYTWEVWKNTKKDEIGKTYLVQKDFDRIRIKYLNRFNIFIKIKWFLQVWYIILIIFLRTGKFKTQKEIAEYRMNICNKCSELNNLKICKVCNCYMPLKTSMIPVRCPIGKW